MIPKHSETHADLIKDSQIELDKLLVKERINRSLRNKIIQSGYAYLKGASLYGLGEGVPCVSDGFYGSKWNCGLIPFETFIDYIRKDEEPFWKYSPPTYKVESLDHAVELLKSNRHKKFFSNGRMCFRGQSQGYCIKRPFPNPFIADKKGYEPLLIPSFWRSYLKNLNQRPVNTPSSIFCTVFADDIIYFGIKNWKSLAVENIKRYGIHTMSDLEDFPDPESQEYGRRWRIHRVNGPYDVQLPLLEQHYGMRTAGLDVTFDLETALFFAVNKFVNGEGSKAKYLPVRNHKHHGIVYCMVYEDPPLTKTSDLVTELRVFEHVPPVRPLRQKCALPFFGAMNINESITEIDAILIIDDEFKISGLQDAKYLFPDTNEDPFYRAILKQKSKYQDVFKDVIEYDI